MVQMCIPRTSFLPDIIYGVLSASAISLPTGGFPDATVIVRPHLNIHMLAYSSENVRTRTYLSGLVEKAECVLSVVTSYRSSACHHSRLTLMVLSISNERVEWRAECVWFDDACCTGESNAASACLCAARVVAEYSLEECLLGVHCRCE